MGGDGGKEWNTLLGFYPKCIVRAALEAREGIECAWPYGDGRAAERIVRTLIVEKVSTYESNSGLEFGEREIS